MKVQIRRVGQHSLPLPKYESKGAAGMDLRARERQTIRAGETQRIPCGFAFAIPGGFEGQVRPRSGHSARGLIVPIGTIDSDYRGEVLVVVKNSTEVHVVFDPGDRIAQLVIAPVVQAELEEVGELDSTERGANGFGSTGTK
jgi:dUTP pyrophosphatase